MMEPIRFDRTRCVNLRHAAVNCRRCETVCAHSVFHWVSSTLRFNAKACEACCACVGVCPTQALSVPAFEAISNTMQVNRLPEALTISCSDVELQSTSAIQIPCLHALTPSRLLHAYLAGVRQLTLCHASCEHCAKRAHRSFVDTVDYAQRVLMMFGESLTVTWVKDAEHISHSRRAFFIQPLRQIQTEQTEPLPCLTGDETTWVNPHHPPTVKGAPDQQKQLFLALLLLCRQTKTLAHGAMTGLKRPELTTNCADCGLCALVCPTGALHEDTLHNSWQVLSMACVQCEACARVCPHQAVRFVENELQHFLSPVPIVLRERSHAMQVGDGSDAWEQKLGLYMNGVPVYRT